MRDLGMKLDSVACAAAMLERGDRRARRGCGDLESRRRFENPIAVTGPHALMLRRRREERRFGGDVDLRASILPFRRRFHLAVEEVSGELHAVADAEDGDAELEDFSLAIRRGLGINGLGTTGEDDGARRELADLPWGEVERLNDGVDVVFADASRDQLRVLGAEIEDENGLLGIHARILVGTADSVGGPQGRTHARVIRGAVPDLSPTHPRNQQQGTSNCFSGGLAAGAACCAGGLVGSRGGLMHRRGANAAGSSFCMVRRALCSRCSPV